MANEATTNPNAFYGKFAEGSAYVKNLQEQLKQHRRKCRKLGRLVGEGRADVDLLKKALKAIVDQAEVHGFWNAEHEFAETALDHLAKVEAERIEEAKKRRGEE